jgi:hypothetical protein
VNKEHRLNDLGIAIEDLDMFQKKLLKAVVKPTPESKTWERS